jgi:hypothetical protein
MLPEYLSPYFTKKKFLQFSIWAIVFVFLFGLRIYLLPNIGLWSYDSCKNFMILAEIHQGNFSNIFVHASPLLYFVFFLVSLVSENYIFLNIFNAFLATIVVFLGLGSLKKYDKLVFSLFLGTSFFMMSASRYFSIDILGLLLFCIFFIYYRKNERHFFYKGILLGLVFAVNYKVALAIGVLVLYDVFLLGSRIYSEQTKNIDLLKKMILKVLQKWVFITFGIISFTLLIASLGVLLGKPFYVLPASWFKIIWQPNMIQKSGQEFSFYFRYFFGFENFIIFFGILLSVFYTFQSKQKNLQKINLELFFVIVYFFVMCFIPKAPRGLVFIYPMLYLLVFQALRRFIIRNSVFYSIIFLSIAVQIYRFQIFTYSYSETNYPKIVQYLNKHKITKVASVVSLQIVPFLPKNISFASFKTQEELKLLKNQGFEYVLLDSSLEIANLQIHVVFAEAPILQFSEPSLLFEILYLEHSEFSGFSYTQSLENQKKLKAQKYHLKLYKL